MTAPGSPPEAGRGRGIALPGFSDHSRHRSAQFPGGRLESLLGGMAGRQGEELMAVVSGLRAVPPRGRGAAGEEGGSLVRCCPYSYCRRYVLVLSPHQVCSPEGAGAMGVGLWQWEESQMIVLRAPELVVLKARGDLPGPALDLTSPRIPPWNCSGAERLRVASVPGSSFCPSGSCAEQGASCHSARPGKRHSPARGAEGTLFTSRPHTFWPGTR